VEFWYLLFLLIICEHGSSPAALFPWMRLQGNCRGVFSNLLVSAVNTEIMKKGLHCWFTE